jgi:hypothetical protein
MQLQNTTGNQDRAITSAQGASDIDNLIEIIQDLDQQITDWIQAAQSADCSTPEQLEEFLSRIEST